ncbi:hypothetical protein AMAG_01126 [Allomyces macrogynus ATCC 38327]|uniref:Uncharacterized protein n=1 Tax=Allomyces macrogynus (strain ATCC 38327) TaxID=578462 RepID=A0A0L0RXU4_ALLM3|nr:hypothetical protein AMAG_01126 [Allomyces macrogynus ATCC 38327]|eukprot:KNE55212.1 hypothetical protein AMAG_01126 [Allomyces macrogynus ATCC 38327]
METPFEWKKRCPVDPTTRPHGDTLQISPHSRYQAGATSHSTLGNRGSNWRLQPSPHPCLLSHRRWEAINDLPMDDFNKVADCVPLVDEGRPTQTCSTMSTTSANSSAAALVSAVELLEKRRNDLDSVATAPTSSENPTLTPAPALPDTLRPGHVATRPISSDLSCPARANIMNAIAAAAAVAGASTASAPAQPVPAARPNDVDNGDQAQVDSVNNIPDLEITEPANSAPSASYIHTPPSSVHSWQASASTTRARSIHSFLTVDEARTISGGGDITPAAPSTRNSTTQSELPSYSDASPKPPGYIALELEEAQERVDSREAPHWALCCGTIAKLRTLRRVAFVYTAISLAYSVAFIFYETAALFDSTGRLRVDGPILDERYKSPERDLFPTLHLILCSMWFPATFLGGYALFKNLELPFHISSYMLFLLAGTECVLTAVDFMRFRDASAAAHAATSPIVLPVLIVRGAMLPVHIIGLWIVYWTSRLWTPLGVEMRRLRQEHETRARTEAVRAAQEAELLARETEVVTASSAAAAAAAAAAVGTVNTAAEARASTVPSS